MLSVQQCRLTIPAICFTILLLCVVSRAFGQLPSARIGYVFPAGGKAGTSFEVSVIGVDLDEPTGLYFSKGGISATPLDDSGRFTITISSNVSPCVCDVRFLGRFGVSNPRSFTVGTFPEHIAPGTNGSQAGAFDLPMNSTINGRISPNAVSWFRFIARKSERQFIECAAEKLDSRLNPVITVVDSSGRELERARTGLAVDFTPPSDGTYFLKLSDTLYRGGDEYFYRLTRTTAPRLDFVLPPAAQPGRTNFLLYGRNLPGGKPAKGIAIDGKALEYLAVEIRVPSEARTSTLWTDTATRPPEAFSDGFDYRFDHQKGISNPIRIGFATAPVVLEEESNDTPARAQKLHIPCEVGGQFYPGTDSDWFTFEAKKGDVYWIEVLSHRLGLPTDPFLLVQHVRRNQKGEEQATDVLELYDTDTNVGEREFNTTSRDPSARFEAKEDGTYRVLVRDLFQRAERSPRFAYRLCIRNESPDFRVVAMPLAHQLKPDGKNIDTGVPVLRRAETVLFRVMAYRRDGFNGDIELSLKDLPPGLSFEGDRIPAGKNSDFILLTAAEDAPAFVGPIRLLATANVGGQERSREVRAGTMISPVANYDTERTQSRLAKDLTIGITDKETAPISISAVEKKIWEASPTAKVEIPLHIVRRGEFTSALKLKPLGPGSAEALKEFDVEAKTTNATFILDIAALKLTPGLHQFALQTQATGKYRNNPEAAAAAEAAVKNSERVVQERKEAAKEAKARSEMATQTVKKLETDASEAEENLQKAKTALETDPTDVTLTEARDVAEKTVTVLREKVRAAKEATDAAIQADAAAEIAVKQADEARQTAAAKAKRTADKAKPRDVTVRVYSTPITVRVTAPVEQAKTK